MELATLWRRNLAYHWRVGLAVLLGAAAGTAVLTGALLVGDSMRGSLRERALARLAGVEYAVIGGGFFREELAAQIEEAAGAGTAAPVILLRGGATHAGTRARVDRVAVIGFDHRLLRVVYTGDSGGSATAVEAAGGRSRGRDGREAATPTTTVRAARLEADAANGLCELDDDGVILNEPLARELGASAGTDVLLRLSRPAEVSPETLLGRREDGVVTMRLTVRAILAARGLGGFSWEPGTADPLSALVSLRALQRALGQPGRASAILLSGVGSAANRPETAGAGGDGSESLRSVLKSRIRLEDYGLRVRVEPRYGYFALESSAILLAPPAAEAARAVARRQGLAASAVLAHLANRIERVRQPGEREADAIPYSTVVAVSDASELELVKGTPAALSPGEILLNEWAAEQLGASPGDGIRLTYYVTGNFGRLEVRQNEFRLTGVARLREPRPPSTASTSAAEVGRYDWRDVGTTTEGRREWGTGADPGWVPDYRGITDTPDIADWDPPFPVDLQAIRPIDEQYWDEFRATPKAFIALEEGQELWGHQTRQVGDLTSLRLRPAGSAPPAEQGRSGEADLRRAASDFVDALLAALDPERMGIRVEALARRAEKAARGATDFGALFVGLSLFLIASAAMLVTLLFRLGVERRAREIGLLLATGYPQRTVRRLLLAEGALLAAGGAAVGLVLALGYSTLMLRGLHSQWVDAVGAPFLRLHVGPGSLAIGAAASLAIALGSIALGLRGVARRSPRALLAGDAARLPPVAQLAPADLRVRRQESPVLRVHGSGRQPSPLLARLVFVVACALAVALVGLSTLTGVVPQTAAFFAGGASLLAGLLARLRIWLVCPPRGAVHRPGLLSLARLGVRNARRNAGRSQLTAGVLACAVFLITSMEALRPHAPARTHDRRSGTGGFALVAESATPLLFDLNTTEGRNSLGLSDEATAVLHGAQVVPLRLRPGDETSCLSLYQPVRPRIVGVPEALIVRGGFEFVASLAETPEQQENPWLLLRRGFADGALAAIGDEASVVWQLRSGLGRDVEITDERGGKRRLRFVALLRGSVLQSELIVAESRFVELFPSTAGYGFFLIRVPEARVTEVQMALERGLERFGFDAQPSRERLSSYFAVQNTYLSAFQTLGGLGMLLGALGLTAVVLRSIWERRGELALLRALGWSRVQIGGMLLAEQAALVVGGLIIGVVPALLAVAPRLAQAPTQGSWPSLAGLVGVVLVTALGVATLALASALKVALLPALRRE